MNINYFLENPRTSSGNAALSFTTSLTTAHTRNGTITGLAGNCVLQNSLFRLTTDGLYPSYVAVPTTGTMNYSPFQPEFRQLNAFYNAATLTNLMASLGASLSGVSRISIDANCNYQDNAYYSPSTNSLCLGYVSVGPGQRVWSADDADVVIHESGHAVNHALASTSILGSTGEAGAIDESIADYWALTTQNDGQLSEWFLGAISPSLIRDATQTHLYPNTLLYEVHADARILTEVLWDLRATGNLGKATTDALVHRALTLLPATTAFKDFYEAFYDASGPAFLNLTAPQRALIVSKFTASGIHRVDTASGLRLSTSGGAIKQVYVIDDHATDSQINGNCNGALDVGETALVMVNLENPNAGRMGWGMATLAAAPAGIVVASGGNIGEFFRFNASSDFVASLPSGSSRQDATYWASFLLRATTTGVKNLSLTYTPMYADPTHGAVAGASVAVSFAVNVGSVATSSNCTNAALWP